jgi:GT2 family glycosyltransferase
MVSSFDDENLGAVAGMIKGYQAAGVIESFHGLFTLQALGESKTFRSFSLVRGGFPTANLMVRKDVFDQVGGFDETLSVAAEDYDLCARIYQRGFTIKSVSKGLIYHKNRSDVRATVKQAFQSGEGHSLLLKKHFTRYLLLELGKLKFFSRRVPLRAWLDISSADKKMGLILGTGIFSPVLYSLIPAYFLYLIFRISVRARKAQEDAAIKDCAAMAGLLLLKSASITMGRVWGSVRNGVLCL